MKERIRVVGALIVREEKYLITQRPPWATLPLLWEFPGGRVREGEKDESALVRKLKELMNVDICVGEQMMHVQHVYPSYDIDFCVYHCDLRSEEIEHRRIHDHRWVSAEEFDRYSFPAADQKTFEQLLEID